MFGKRIKEEHYFTMAQTTMIRIPKDISNRIDIIKALHPKQNLTKEEWAVKIIIEGLTKYEKQQEKYRFK